MANNIRELRGRAKLTVRELAERIGVHFTTLAKLERGERRLTQEWMEKIAPVLGVTSADLIAENMSAKPVRMVPLVGTIAAGNWREAIANPIEHVPALGGGRNAFALLPEGDSMNRAIPAGGYVVIDPDEVTLIDGKIYAIMNGGGDATLKRFRANPPRLEPDSTNPEHQPIPIGLEPFQLVGRVIWITIQA